MLWQMVLGDPLFLAVVLWALCRMARNGVYARRIRGSFMRSGHALAAVTLGGATEGPVLRLDLLVVMLLRSTVWPGAVVVILLVVVFGLALVSMAVGGLGLVLCGTFVGSVMILVGVKLPSTYLCHPVLLGTAVALRIWHLFVLELKMVIVVRWSFLVRFGLLLFRMPRMVGVVWIWLMLDALCLVWL